MSPDIPPPQNSSRQELLEYSQKYTILAEHKRKIRLMKRSFWDVVIEYYIKGARKVNCLWNSIR